MATNIDPLAAPKEHSQTLWSMTAEERQEAMWTGRLSAAECWEWAKLAPHEVPLIENEFAFIAAFTPEVADAQERGR
jgi:hypothetical protein